MSRSQRIVFIFGCLLSVFLLTPAIALAQSDVAGDKITIKANNRPLVSLKEAADKARDRPVVPAKAREVLNFGSKGAPAPSGTTALSNAILQESAGNQITVIGGGFFGASNHDNSALLGFLVAPPDTDGQVGPDHYVQMINLLTTIFDKSGNIVEGPFPSNVFWQGIGGNCEAYNQGDPIVLYDDIADRWLVSQFAFPDSLGSFSQCVAVSTSGDPAGGWNRYEFPFDSYGLNDYPKHGIVSESITMSAHLFQRRRRNFSFAGAFLGVMDKAAMYAGASNATLIGFNIGTGEFGFVAGDLDGTGDVPALFATATSTVSAFDIWRVDVDWASKTASRTQIASVAVTPFDYELCTAPRGACIPQPEGGPLLESLSDRLMHRLQIRDFGTYRSMVTAHTVDVGGGRAGIRWYELRETNGTDWSLYQEGTYAPADAEYRFMPSAAMNAAGDIGIGYLLSGTQTYVSTAVAGQTASASGSGLLNSEELICGYGTGVQTGVSRSGDYSSTSIDPVDDSFWHTNEVFTETGDFLWNTYVCEFMVADSGENIPPSANFSYDCSELACSFTDESLDSDGSVVSWRWNFGDTNTSMLANPSHTYAAGGDYTVTLLVTDNEGATDAATQTVPVTGPVVNLPPTASFSYDCNELACSFSDQSLDPDGAVVSWIWNFGDTNTSTLANPSHTYAAGGDYTVTLLVTDNEGATDSATQTVTVTGPVVNLPPTAAFTYDCTDLSCDFDGSGSSDTDGSIVSFAWNFGEGGTANGALATHVFGTAGAFDVSLTVTDDDAATDADTQTVTVTTGGVPTLEGTAETISKTWWRAIVKDTSGGVLQGTWSESGIAACSGSICTLSNIHKKITSVTFTATGSGVQITILKP